MLLFGSWMAYVAEHPANPEFANFGDSLWWGIVTLTTVGYGDIVPETTKGRTAAVFLMLTGIGTLGVISGTLASAFRRSAARGAGRRRRSLRLSRSSRGRPADRAGPRAPPATPSIEQHLAALAAARVAGIAEPAGAPSAATGSTDRLTGGCRLRRPAHLRLAP